MPHHAATTHSSTRSISTERFIEPRPSRNEAGTVARNVMFDRWVAGIAVAILAFTCAVPLCAADEELPGIAVMLFADETANEWWAFQGANRARDLFAAELDAGKVVWKVLNYEEPAGVELAERSRSRWSRLRARRRVTVRRRTVSRSRLE